MTSLDSALIAIVAHDTVAAERRASALRAAGATVTVSILEVDGWSTLSVPGFDAIVIDGGEHVPDLLRAIREDSRTHDVPRLLLLPAGAPGPTLAALAEDGDALPMLSADATDAAVVRAVGSLVAQRRQAQVAAQHLRALQDDLRTCTQRGVDLRQDVQTIVHDTRVLLAVVVGFGCNLRDEIAGPVTPTQREHVVRMVDAANDASALLERHSATTRAEGATAMSIPPAAPPQRVARRTLQDLPTLVTSVVSLFRDAAAERRIDLAYAQDESVRLWGDGMQLKQVVTNLLVNALKFTPRGGRVRVTLRATEPSLGRGVSARRSAEIIVTDSGHGIAIADRERIFQRGTRLERDAGIPGTGIGLAVVRELVTAHGGQVRVEDGDGGGASFVVTLPTDMRVRAERGILFLRDGGAARQLIEAMEGMDASQLRASLGTPEEAFVRALDACGAIVIVPRNGATADRLEGVLGSLMPSGHLPVAKRGGT